jgi:hypothetical protein
VTAASRSGGAIVWIGVVLAIVACERLLSAALMGAADSDAVSIRLLIAFVCGGLSPVMIVLGYLRHYAHKRSAN